MRFLLDINTYIGFVIGALSASFYWKILPQLKPPKNGG